MNKEQLLKSCDLIRDYNEDLFKKLRVANKVIKGKSKTKKYLEVEQIQEILILISILLSGNIKIRYELEDFIKENGHIMPNPEVVRVMKRRMFGDDYSGVFVNDYEYNEDGERIDHIMEI